MECEVRPSVKADTASVMDIIRRTKFFRPTEEVIAEEVLNEAALGDNSYQSYVAFNRKTVAGWICFGHTPCTLGTFDIYWIAVDPDLQRMHIGSRLLDFAEHEIAKQNGRMIVIETSGSALYRPTQRFYKKNGYTLVSEVPDFYAPDDSKLIFTKKL